MTDAIDYVRYLASEATANRMKMGLKNAQGILDQVSDVVEFAVNE